MVGLKHHRARRTSPEPWSYHDVMHAEQNMGKAQMPCRVGHVTKPGKREESQTLSERTNDTSDLYKL